MSKTFEGIIRGVEISDGMKKDGLTPWKRASIKMEDPQTGQKMTFGTFEVEDIKKANELNGQPTQVVYTENESNGKIYNNLVKGAIGPATKGAVAQQPLPVAPAPAVTPQPMPTQPVVEEVNSTSYPDPVSTEKPIGAQQPIKNMAPVNEYKVKEADKFEIGMAKNGAIEFLATNGSNFDEKSYKELVRNIFKAGKEVRQEILGY